MVAKMKCMSINNIEELEECVYDLWGKIPKSTILSYIDALPNKIMYIKDNNGDLYSDHKDRKTI